MFDRFSKEKSDFLKKKDRSKKGHIDEGILEILNRINSKKDYYTTSSCSGRIVLLEKLSSKKNEAKWIFTKHTKIKFNEIKNTLNQYNKNNKNRKNSIFGNFKIKNFEVIRELPLKASVKEETSFGSNGFRHQIWLKQEPLILHVRCRDLKFAKKLLDASRKIFKRAGIISLSEKKIVVEIIGTERIDAIIADKNFAADEDYIKNLVKYANRNFMENKRKSERFLKIIRSNL